MTEAADPRRRRQEHLALLASLISDERITGDERVAFEDMRGDLEKGIARALSRKQLDWLAAVRERINPTYENAWSAGKVPKGRDVETPPSLRNLPKAPVRRCGLCGKPGCAADCI